MKFIKNPLHTGKRAPANLIYYTLFGLFFFIVLFFLYEPELLYFKLQPFFSFDSSYLDFFQRQHHGILTIISNFFLQFLHFRVAGTLLLTLLLLLLALLFKQVFHIEQYPFLKGAEFIPSLHILISLKSYDTGLEALILFIIASLLVLINSYLPLKTILYRAIYQPLAVLFSYLLFGISTCFVLLILLIATEYLFNKNLWRFISLILSSILFCFIVFRLTGTAVIKPLLETLHPSSTRTIIPQFWYLLGFSIILSSVIYSISLIKNKDKLLPGIPVMILNSTTILIVIIVMIFFGKQLFLNSRKYNTQIEYYAFNKEWNRVLALKHKVTLDDRTSLFQLNRALYHTGQMSDKLFSIRQHWGVNTLFLTIEFNRACTINSSDLFYDMGFIKGAKYWALEAQTYNPYSPRILQRLTCTSVLLGDTLTIKKYLTVLSKSIVNRDWAIDLKEKITSEGVENIRKEWFDDRVIEQDIFYINNKNPNLDLIQILKKDAKNRMAYEYLLSYYLLCNELGNFQHFLYHFGSSNIGSLPKLYQQALLMYQLTIHVPENEIEHTISKEVLNDMMHFNKILIEYKLDVRKAKKDLFKLFGDTYWYYFRYNSPQTLGSSIKKKKL